MTVVEATLTDEIEVAGCVTVIMEDVEATTEKEAVVPTTGTTIVGDTTEK